MTMNVAHVSSWRGTVYKNLGIFIVDSAIRAMNGTVVSIGCTDTL